MRMHTRKMSAENIPVRILKASVGLVLMTVEGVCLGLHQRIKSTMRGKMIPVATIRLGVAVQSLKKQMIIPRITNAKRAMVPGPKPLESPS